MEVWRKPIFIRFSDPGDAGAVVNGIHEVQWLQRVLAHNPLLAFDAVWAGWTVYRLRLFGATRNACDDRVNAGGGRSNAAAALARRMPPALPDWTRHEGIKRGASKRDLAPSRTMRCGADDRQALFQLCRCVTRSAPAN